jgi:hypothetical protein
MPLWKPGAAPDEESRVPELVVNPRDDAGFAACVRSCADERSGTSVGELQTCLRLRYPCAVVHPRGLVGEPRIWYVFRDGHWTALGSYPG